MDPYDVEFQKLSEKLQAITVDVFSERGYEEEKARVIDISPSRSSEESNREAQAEDIGISPNRSSDKINGEGQAKIIEIDPGRTSQEINGENQAGITDISLARSSEETNGEKLDETSTNGCGGAEDDDQSHGSGSTTPNSTSTYTYSQESYESFKQKAIDLIIDIGGRDVELQDRIRGGGYNRIVPAKFFLDSKLCSSAVVAVLRIPRSHDLEDDTTEEDGSPKIDGGMLNQVSVWRFVHDLGFPSPRVLAFDATAHNTIGSPYAVHEFAEGTRLDSLYENMQYEERRGVVDQLVDMLLKLEKVEFPVCGRLRRSKGQNEYSTLSLTQSFEQRAEPQLDEKIRVEGLGVHPHRWPKETQPMEDVYSMLDEQLCAQMAEERAYKDAERNPVIPMLAKLQSVLRDMKSLDLSPNDQARNVLYHSDLEPRNLLFAPTPDPARSGTTKWTLKAVIDWDDALSLPPILTRRPPTWIWDYSVLDPEAESVPSHYDDDDDLLDPSFYNEGNGRLSPEDQAMRAYFENSFVQRMSLLSPAYTPAAYQDEAYGTGRWLRRLSRFAIHGFGYSQDFSRYEKFVREWDEFQARSIDSRVS